MKNNSGKYFLSVASEDLELVNGGITEPDNPVYIEGLDDSPWYIKIIKTLLFKKWY